MKPIMRRQVLSTTSSSTNKRRKHLHSSKLLKTKNSLETSPIHIAQAVAKMAAMAALQSSFTSLSLSSNSFIGQRLFPSPTTFQVKTEGHPPCLIVMRLKRWERKDCKPNSLPKLHKMHVKIGDTVKVIAGGEKGKIGEISKIYKHNSTVIVKDINLKTKHVKSKEQGEPGQIIKIEGPIHSSNVMLYSKEKEVASRVGHKILEDGRKVRYLIKTGEIVDTPERLKEILSKKESETAVAAPAS